MRFIDDALDFIVFIALFGLVLTTSFTIVVPALSESSDEVAYVDKSAPALLGYDVDSGYDGSMSRLEAVLVTQIQDFDIPEPKVYAAQGADTLLRISETYESKANLATAKRYVVNWMNTQGGTDTRFELGYNLGKIKNNAPNALLNGSAEQYSVAPDGDITVNNWDGRTDNESPTFGLAPAMTNGSQSFLISAPQGDALKPHQGSWIQGVNAKLNTRYELTADMSCENCEGVIQVDVTTSDNKTKTYLSSFVKDTNAPQTVRINFTTAHDATRIDVSLRKTGSSGTGAEAFKVDNVQLIPLADSDEHYEIRKFAK